MRVFGRLLIILAVLLPVSAVATQAASGAGSGDGTAVMKCMHWKDDMRVTPGLTNSPGNQSVTAHGRVYGCNKAGGGGTFTANLHMTAASCADYSLSGTGEFVWANGNSSTATFLFQQQFSAPAKFLVSGRITGGLFDTLLIHAWLRFSLENTGAGQMCSAENAVEKLSFTNSQSLQLFTPVEPTTTIPQPPPPPPTTQPAVPVTSSGNNTSPTTCCVAVAAVVAQTPPPSNGGALAFTGSGGLGALLGVEALLVGAALGLLGEDRRRRAARLAVVHTGPRKWLQITLPPE